MFKKLFKMPTPPPAPPAPVSTSPTRTPGLLQSLEKFEINANKPTEIISDCGELVATCQSERDAAEIVRRFNFHYPDRTKLAGAINELLLKNRATGVSANELADLVICHLTPPT